MQETTVQKFKVQNPDELIEILKNMFLTKKMVLFNIQKYGFYENEDYILSELGFKVTKKNTNSNIKVSQKVLKQAEIFKLIFNIQKQCFVRIRNNKTNEYRAYSVQAIQNPYKLQKILSSNRFKENTDLMYSLNCYNNMYKHESKNIFSLQNFAVDVDFNTEQYTINQVLSIIEELYKNNSIPIPNLVEYGHRVRLIYSIADVYASAKTKNLVSKINRVITSKIPHKLNASPQPLTTSARILSSINTKINDEIKIEILKREKYTLKYFREEYLPPVQQSDKVRSNKKVIQLQNNYVCSTNRLEDLERIQKIKEESLHEVMCFLYRNYCIMSGLSAEEALQKTIEFNNNFKKPLVYSRLLYATRNVNRKQYKYRDYTFLRALHISREEEKTLKLSTLKMTEIRKVIYNANRREKYKNDLKKAGKNTKQEELKNIRKKIIALRQQGMKNKEITIKLKMPLKTLERHISYLQKSGLL